MAPPKELNFITGNKNKLAEVQAILSETAVDLRSQAVDLVEIQGTIEEISRDKAIRAAEAVCLFSFTFIFFCDLYLVLSKPHQFISRSLFTMSTIISLPHDYKWNYHTGMGRMLTNGKYRSRDRFWLRIRACALTPSTSCRVLMCTCYALCLSTMPNHSFLPFALL
jgi:hypothetical protein